MEHTSAPSDLAYHQQASIILEQAGFSPDLFVKMHRSQSSHLSSQKSLKRKSRGPHEPRSVSNSHFTPTQSLNSHDISRATAEMNRHHSMPVQSAPTAVALTRGPSRKSISNRSPAIPSWQNDAANLGLTMPLRKDLQHIDGTWQDPADFTANMPDFTVQPQLNYTTNSVTEQQLSDPELLSATSGQFSWPAQSSSSLNSPRYSIDYTDASSLSPTNMSRDPTRSSFSSNIELTDPSLAKAMSMMRVKSEASHLSRSDSQSYHHAPLGAAPQPYPQHNFVPDHSPATNYMNTHQTSLESQSTFDFIDDPSLMQRSASNSTTSSTSSNFHHISRSKRRHLETLEHQSQRSIAPALNQHSSSSSRKREHTHEQHHSVKMERVTSESGEEKMCAVIPRDTERQRRPAPQKLFCPFCNDQPDGFRGEHELQRHSSRAHSKIRKVWVCLDSSSDKKFLSNCKACRTGKKYGAYYNAAAHLRRTHFNPRKRGRRSKGEEYEKRGGKGGGHWPPMNDLKENWMREVEEVVTDDTPALIDDAEVEATEDFELESINQNTTADYTIHPQADSNAPNFASAGFDNSPINGYMPIFANDTVPNMNFDDIMMPFAGDLLSQATGIYDGDTFLDGSHGYLPPQHTVAFDATMGGPMWAAQS